MIIPITISLLISTIFLNFGLSLGSQFLALRNDNAVKASLVLGAREYQTASEIIIEQGNNFNQALNNVIEDVKALPQFTQPLQSQTQEVAAVKTVDFDLEAENGAILDCQNDNLFFSKNPDRVWPIASITKLFTAYTFLEFNPGWEMIYKIRPEDKREGGKIYLYTGDEVKVKDLFYFSLVGSDNTATIALVHATGMSEQEFVQKINDKNKNLGLKNTKFTDVIGLSDNNVSTSREIAMFAKTALNEAEISQAVLTEKYEFTTVQGRKKSIGSTDQLLSIFPENGVNILGGKTGFTNSAGYCMVGRFKNEEGKEIITVVLGADSEVSRFGLTRELVDLYYNN